jgi:hypothetical protein
MRKTVFGCCASAGKPRTNANVAAKIDDRTSFCIAPLVLETITHAVIAKRIIYGRWQQCFVEGEKAKFDVGLN